MRARPVWVGIAVALLVSGCGGGGADSSKESNKQVPAPAPATASATASAAQQAYLDALGGIDPGLVVNKDRAVSRGKSVCRDIKEGKDSSTVVRNAALRFDGGNASVDEAKAQHIVQAIQSTKFCG